jgi:hypothetical protein
MAPLVVPLMTRRPAVTLGDYNENPDGCSFCAANIYFSLCTVSAVLW